MTEAAGWLRQWRQAIATGEIPDELDWLHAAAQAARVAATLPEGVKLFAYADGSLLSWSARDAAQVVQPSGELVRQLAFSGDRGARELAVRLTGRLQ